MLGLDLFLLQELVAWLLVFQLSFAGQEFLLEDVDDGRVLWSRAARWKHGVWEGVVWLIVSEAMESLCLQVMALKWVTLYFCLKMSLWQTSHSSKSSLLVGAKCAQMLSILSLSFKGLVKIVLSHFHMLLELALLTLYSRYRTRIPCDAPVELSIFAHSVLQNRDGLFLSFWILARWSSWLWSCRLQLICARVILSIPFLFDIVCMYCIFDVWRLTHGIFCTVMPLELIFMLRHFWRRDWCKTISLVYLSIFGIATRSIFQRCQIICWLKLIVIEAVECWMPACVLMKSIFSLVLRVVAWLLGVARFIQFQVSFMLLWIWRSVIEWVWSGQGKWLTLFKTCDVTQRLSASHCLVSEGANSIAILVCSVAMGVNGLHLHSLGARLFSWCHWLHSIVRVSSIWIFSIA